MENKYSNNVLIDYVEDESIDIEEETEEEIQSDEEERKLYVDKVDKSTSDLLRMILEGELNLQPEYQRKMVWNRKTMSKFIESLLLSIPIPTLFLAENNDETFEVIDGQQRLTTIFLYMKSSICDEQMNKVSSELQGMSFLVLEGLETLKQYNGTKYTDLDNIKRKFNNVSLPIVIIKKDSTEDIKYDIFSRINSGAVKLNDQELLNVMYRGLLIDKLNILSSLKDVDDLFGNRPVLKKRYGYNSVLLRAKVMESFIDDNTWRIKEVEIKHNETIGKKTKKYNGRLKSSIIEYLKEYRNDCDEVNNIESFINRAIKNVEIVFGSDAFKRINKPKSTSINKTVAETQLVVLSKFEFDKVQKNKERIKESFCQFLKDNDENLFIRGTNNTSNVEKRYLWGKRVSEIINED